MDEAVDSCRAMADLGCDNNGKFRQFLKKEDITQFREHLKSMLETADDDFHRLLCSFLDMPMLTFWMFFGPRMHVSYDFVENLAKNHQKKHEN